MRRRTLFLNMQVCQGMLESYELRGHQTQPVFSVRCETGRGLHPVSEGRKEANDHWPAVIMVGCAEQS